MSTPIKSKSPIKQVAASLTLSEHMVAIRKSLGKTQIEFAKLLGTSKPTVSDIESGARIPSPLIAARFAERLGLSVSDFVRLALQALVDRDGLSLIVHINES